MERVKPDNTYFRRIDMIQHAISAYTNPQCHFDLNGMDERLRREILEKLHEEQNILFKLAGEEDAR